MLVAALAAAPAAARVSQTQPAPAPAPAIVWRHSQPIGLWWAGSLRNGVQLPAEGPDWFTWDPALNRSPDRGWRRWGTDRLVATLLQVLAAYRAAHPGVPRVGIGDLSRRHGGPFGARYGGLGHVSHQNGLDADVYYPRKDGLERRASKPSQVDQALAQELVNRFVRAGAITVYVGPHLSLRGRRGVVIPRIYHDDHLHVRLPLRPRRGGLTPPTGDG
jgi:murein endopeptidase